MKYLGHIVENGHIQPHPNKTSAVQKLPEPKTIKQLQSFLGLTGYFRKFIKGYAEIAKPLSDVTKQNVKFKIDVRERSAIETLKSA